MTANVPAEDEVEKVDGGIVDCDTFFIKRGRVARILERKKVKVQSEKSVVKNGRVCETHCIAGFHMTSLKLKLQNY